MRLDLQAYCYRCHRSGKLPVREAVDRDVANESQQTLARQSSSHQPPPLHLRVGPQDKSYPNSAGPTPCHFPKEDIARARAFLFLDRPSTVLARMNGSSKSRWHLDQSLSGSRRDL